MHGSANAWCSPLGYKKYDPTDIERQKWDLEYLTTKLYEKFGTNYTTGSSYDVIYPAGGSLKDWTYEKLGVTRSYLHELRYLCHLKDSEMSDREKVKCRFQPSFKKAEDLILPEAWFGFKELIIESFKQDFGMNSFLNK